MGKREEFIAKVKKLMYQPERIRNIGIVAHVDHGKTTLSDSLLADAGIISEDLAGKQLYLDFDELEKKRGITIQAANITLVHNYDGQEYLINLIDTPGHVDFGSEVVRAMRAVDGVIVVVCAVEGVMPQTETVLRQALQEKVKPILFINKVDRLIKELKLTPQEMQNRFIEIISEINELICKMKADEWQVKVQDGSVMFGSAYHKWALSMPYMQKAGISFKDIISAYQQGNEAELFRRAPLCKVVLDSVIKHLPNPLQAQKYRIPVIWAGDESSDVAKDMMKCDSKGRLVIMTTKIIVDPHAGEVAVGRVFSGIAKPGIDVYMINSNRTGKIQQVSLYMGPERVIVDEVPAGNIVALLGLKGISAGETIASEKITPFESLRISEPVITKTVEPTNPRDLAKLIEALKSIAKEDPSVRVEIDEETGEYKISGMGELHLEIIEHKLRRDKKLDIKTSEPIVVYRETVLGKSKIVEGKSPNKHNKFYIVVEPLEDGVYDMIINGEIPQGKIKKKEMWKKFVEGGMPREEAKNVVCVHGTNVLVDMTKGIQHLRETMELIIEGFENATDKGPLAQEKVAKVKVKLVDCVLHEDAVHRGPAQVLPAVKGAIHEAMKQANPTLLEPMQNIHIRVPEAYLGAVTREIQSRRGQILDMKQEGDLVEILAKAPIAEMFGFAGAIRSATEGRVLWSTENAGFERVPNELVNEIIRSIRQRKGLPLEEEQEA